MYKLQRVYYILVQAFLNLAEKQKNKRQEIDRDNLI